jgi:tetratricopeptide (TPR) repeat protein
MRHHWIVIIRQLYAVAGIVAVLSAVACAPAIQPLPADDIFDHYQTGMQKLAQNDLAGAETLFTETIDRGKGMPHGHTGMAYLMLARTNYRGALGHADDALEIDPAFVDALAARGRILTLRKRGDWRREALEPLNAALEKTPDDHRARYYLGELHLDSGEYGRALAAYDAAASGTGPFAEAAAERQRIIGPFVENPPRTDGTLGLLLDDKIDRAGLCALLEEDMGIAGLLRQQRPEIHRRLFTQTIGVDVSAFSPPDVRKHRYETCVREVLPLDLYDLRVLPDGRFYPDRLITRAQLAVVIQSVLVLVSDDELHATRFVGASSPFPDVRSDIYAFNAIMLCIDQGIMRADQSTGAFQPDDPVSGFTALSALRRTESLLTDRE